jgi:acyl-CoA thioesterase I
MCLQLQMERQMTDARPRDLHPEITKLDHELRYFKESLLSRRKIKVVAIGSSSVAGEGDVIPFPARLELALRKRYPDRMIDVINRGIGGQEAPEEAARFGSDLIDEAPVLAIWQVGTNAIYHRDLYDPGRVAGTIATALSWLKALPMDVILMDLQYAPALLGAKEKDTRTIVGLISAVAVAAPVNLFRRFALMEQWVTKDGVDQAVLIGPDGVHQTEIATDCVTQALDIAIGNVTGPVPGVPTPSA